MKKAKIYLLSLVGLLSFSACNARGSQKGTSKSETPKSELPPAYEETWDNYDERYNGYSFKNKIGMELMTEIHNYFIDQHKTYVTYGNYWYYINTAADLIPGTQNNELFYTGKASPRTTHDGQDREHVWPCASSNGLWWRSSDYIETNIEKKGNSYWGGGSDLYHVRPATSRVNQSRLNASFYQFSDEEKLTCSVLQDGGPYKVLINDKATKVEVDDAYKGDVARIIMYVFTHYSKLGNKNVYYSESYEPVYSLAEAVVPSSEHTPDVCGRLGLSDILAYKNINECYETLCIWNRIDPPSEVEVNRNNYVETIQGNRNPFVDYPQLVDKCLIS